jgi:hypothetical protein
MQKWIIFLAVLMTAGIAVSEDFVEYHGPAAKDLSNLNITELQAIFSGDGWFSADLGGSMWTPSINAFLADGDEGKPQNVTKKTPLRCGGM